MPIITITFPEGYLDKQKKSELTEKISLAVLQAEGFPDTSQTRPLAWCFLNETKNWNIGCSALNELRFYITIRTLKNLMDTDRKKEMLNVISKTLDDLFQSNYNPVTFINFIEQDEGSWGIGTDFLRLKDLAHISGLDKESKRFKELVR